MIKKYFSLPLVAVFFLVMAIVHFTSIVELRNITSLLGFGCEIVLRFALIFFLLCIIKRKWILFLVSFSISLNIILGILFRSRLSLSMLGTILETNPKEVRDFSSTILLFFILLPVVTFVIIRASRDAHAIFFIRVSKNYILIGLVSLFILGNSLALYFKYDKKPAFTFNYFCWSLQYAPNHFPIVLPLFTQLPLYGYFKLRYAFYSSSSRAIPAGISPSRSELKKIILIIGESASRHRFSIYGYNENTTPFLLSLQVKDSIIIANAISSHYFTRAAVPSLLSFANNVAQDGLFFQHKNLVELADLAGYQTYWFSTQEAMGPNENDVSLITNSCSKAIFIHDDDLGLLKPLLSHYGREEKQFFVIQMCGSHRPYANFDSADELAIPLGNTADYDRTIHHTDRLLDSIYRACGSTSLICYLSDHADFPDKRINRQGGFKDCFDVPFIFMGQHLSKADSLMTKYYTREVEAINTGSTVYMFSELFGYAVSDSLVRKAVEKGKYVFNNDEPIEFSKLKYYGETNR